MIKVYIRLGKGCVMLIGIREKLLPKIKEKGIKEFTLKTVIQNG